tara:strand:- start:95729 stop:96106 length:378 start_codon:yes stop_codon:yes gene_type:complete
MTLQNKPIPNPLRGESVVISFKAFGFSGFDNANVCFSYVPDREVLAEEIFSNWFQSAQKKSCDTIPELTANEMLNTFYHEVLPYHVNLDIVIQHKTGVTQRIQVIKNQPNYNLPLELKERILTNV